MSREHSMKLLAVGCVALLAASCATPTPTPTPAPSRTVTPSLPTPTATWPLPVTYSPTQADPTPRPSHTPTPCGTCEPINPSLLGGVTIACLEDTDGDGIWDEGDDENAQEWAVPCTITLLYDGALPLSIWPVTGVQVPIGWRGIGVYSLLLPGLYNVLVTSYEEQACLVPYHDNPIWAQVQAAGQAHLLMRFWRRPGCYSYGTPTVTATPSVTPTPRNYVCPLYSTNCLPSCPGNLMVDPRGQCGPGFVCCVPAPTRTATP